MGLAMSRGPALPVASAFALASLFAPHQALASESDIEVDGGFGYQFGGALDVEVDRGQRGHLYLDAAPAFTGIFGYRFQRNGFVFVNYSRQDTTLHYRSADLSMNGQNALSTEYFQFGGNIEAFQGGLTPYFGFSIGATRFAASGFGDEWRFSLVADGGVKLNVTHWLHLRVFARVPVTILEGESTVFCVNSDCVVAWNGTPMVQGAVFAGAGFSF